MRAELVPPLHPLASGRLAAFEKPWLLAACVCLVGFALYGSILSQYFLADDFVGIADSYRGTSLRPGIEQLARYARVTEEQANWPFVRPTHQLFLWFDAVWWGTEAAGFYVTTLVVFFASVVALFALAREIALPPLLAFAWAAIYVVHPCGVESVAWLSARSDVLAQAFGLFGTVLLVRENRGRARFLAPALGFVLLLLAVTSKEPGLPYLLLPFALLLWRRLREHGLLRTLGRTHSWLLAALPVGLLVAYLAYRHYMLDRVIAGYRDELQLFVHFDSKFALLATTLAPLPAAWSLGVSLVLLAGFVLAFALPAARVARPGEVLLTCGVLLAFGLVVTSTFHFELGVVDQPRLHAPMLLPLTLFAALALHGWASLLGLRLSLSSRPAFLLLLLALTVPLAWQQQRLLDGFDEGSQVTRSLTAQLQELDRPRPGAAPVLVAGAPAEHGAAHVALNMRWSLERPPFFDPAPPRLALYLDDTDGWIALARDLPRSPAFALHLWSEAEQRLVPASLGPPEVQLGRLLVRYTDHQGTCYGLEGQPHEVWFAEPLDAAPTGEAVRIHGRSLRFGDRQLFLAEAEPNRQAPAPQLACEPAVLARRPGQSAHLRLENAAALAGCGYVILGSFDTGSATPLDGSWWLPFVPDAYSVLLLSQPGWIVRGGHGTLGQGGTLNARFALPDTLPPPPAGAELVHVLIAFDLERHVIRAVSRPCRLRFADG